MLGLDEETSTHFASTLRARIAKIEADHAARVDLVVVGDATLNDRTALLIDAAVEAVNNAARHSGAATISVYAEVEVDVISTYVRDDGSGFNTTSIDGERRGVRESIVGRMQRAGGTAVIASGIGEGTEVELRLPLVTQ